MYADWTARPVLSLRFSYLGSMDCMSFRKSAERAWEKKGKARILLLFSERFFFVLFQYNSNMKVTDPYLGVHVRSRHSHSSHLLNAGRSETSKWRPSHLKCWAQIFRAKAQNALVIHLWFNNFIKLSQ